MMLELPCRAVLTDPLGSKPVGPCGTLHDSRLPRHITSAAAMLATQAGHLLQEANTLHKESARLCDMLHRLDADPSRHAANGSCYGLAGDPRCPAPGDRPAGGVLVDGARSVEIAMMEHSLRSSISRVVMPERTAQQDGGCSNRPYPDTIMEEAEEPVLCCRSQSQRGDRPPRRDTHQRGPNRRPSIWEELVDRSLSRSPLHRPPSSTTEEPGHQQQRYIEYVKHGPPQGWYSEAGLDCAIGIVLVLNILVLGFQGYRPWTGWDKVDNCFTLVYVVEILVKLHLHGCFEYFCGKDYLWHLFELALATVAVVELVLEKCSDLSNTNREIAVQVQLMRWARLPRLVRIFRVLHLHLGLFRDFHDILHRLTEGIGSLQSSMVLMFTVIIMAATVMECLIGRRETHPWIKEELDIDDERERHILFSDVFRASFTVFRCINSDCTTTDGSPISLWLAEVYGPFFAIPWAVFVIVVNYGLLNLILTCFVEVTVAAKHADAEFAGETGDCSQEMVTAG